MGFRTKIHKWLIHFWEEPFFKVELARVEISKKLLLFDNENGREGKD